MNSQGSGNLLRRGEDCGRSPEEEDSEESGSAEEDTHRPHSHTMSLWKHYLWCEGVAHTSKTKEKHRTGCSKSPDFSPTQPWRLFHPPAQSLPRQTLCPGTRLVPSNAAAGSLPIPYTSLKGSGRGCPLLRASSDHGFIVGALRARRAPGRSPPNFSASCKG